MGGRDGSERRGSAMTRSKSMIVSKARWSDPVMTGETPHLLVEREIALVGPSGERVLERRQGGADPNRHGALDHLLMAATMWSAVRMMPFGRSPCRANRYH